MTQQYAKFISEDTVKFAPRTLKTPSLIAFNFNQNEELMRSQGYYPLVELNTREEVTDETHYAKPTFSLIQNEESPYITCTYVAEEITNEGDE